MKSLYKRIMIKLSGEGLLGDKISGVNVDVLDNLSRQVKILVDGGYEVCLVIGGGNIFRGGKEYAKWMDRSVADQVGMLATVMNGLFLQEAMKKHKIPVQVFSSLEVPKICDSYVYSKAKNCLESKRVAIFVGGTGNTRFSTDTGAVLRAVEMQCDVIMKATQVDGVYDSDPKINPKATRYEKISFDEVIRKELKVMDMTAIALAKESNLPICVFSQSEENSLVEVVYGKGNYTIINEKG